MYSGFNHADYPVVVGIDFGTTYSGCSYAFVHGDDVIDILKWPRKLNNIYPKTPTVALYDKGSRTASEWGYGAQRTASRPGNKSILISKIKLHLDENLRHMPLPNCLDVLDVITDYLRMFHGHVCGELSKSFAVNYTQDRFRYCLTVPAMWSDKAKALMREAATRAGLVRRGDHPDRLMLISEPEAAALYCEKKAKQFKLTAGQRFLICDAGGGTVDLIVFEIGNDSGGGRTLKEVTKGHGGSCGSGFIDMRMRDYLTHRLSGLGSVSNSAMESLMDVFVNSIKPAFDGIDDHYISLPANVGADTDKPAMGIQDGQMHLPAQDLRDIFNPVVDEVLRLIEGQLMQAPQLESMFLVGGFGQSPYLYNRVNECFDSRVGMIAVPPRGELAVVRGAVYFGLNPKIVTERVSRRTYGVECRMPFMDGIDPVEYSSMDLDGKLYCRHRFSPYIRKGERVKMDQYYDKEFSVTYPTNTDSDLYAFDGDGTPPRLVTHHLIKKVGNFPIKMPHIPGLIPGEKVDFAIRMYFGLTEIKIETTILDKTFVFTSAFDTDTMAVTPRSAPPPTIHRHLSDPPSLKQAYDRAEGLHRPGSSVNNMSFNSNDSTLIDDNPSSYPSELYNNKRQSYDPVKPHEFIDNSHPMKQQHIPIKPQASIRHQMPNQYYSTQVVASAMPATINPAVRNHHSASANNNDLVGYPTNVGQPAPQLLQLQHGVTYRTQLVPTKEARSPPPQQELRQYPHSRFQLQHTYPQNHSYRNALAPPSPAFAAVKPDGFD